MTKKQTVYVEYLLKQLGFQDDNERTNFRESFLRAYGKIDNFEKEKTTKSGYVRYEKKWFYNVSEAIEKLQTEVALKRNLSQINELSAFTNHLSATDYSNFEYCPVNYIISKSFKKDVIFQDKKRLSGEILHRKILLVKRDIGEANQTKIENELFKLLQSKKIDKIRNCELIFHGHKTESQYFKNIKENFIGQPDYIFKDPNERYFVVEEKFMYRREEFDSEITNHNLNFIVPPQHKKGNFHTNHIIQVQSYLNFISKYQLSYGILLYWFYEFCDNKARIYDFSIKVIDRKVDKLLSIRQSIQKLQSGDPIEFRKPSANKCANCISTMYCGHKSNLEIKATFPYKKNHLSLTNVPFPKLLTIHMKEINKVLNNFLTNKKYFSEQKLCEFLIDNINNWKAIANDDFSEAIEELKNDGQYSVFFHTYLNELKHFGGDIINGKLDLTNFKYRTSEYALKIVDSGSTNNFPLLLELIIKNQNLDQLEELIVGNELEDISFQDTWGYLREVIQGEPLEKGECQCHPSSTVYYNDQYLALMLVKDNMIEFHTSCENFPPHNTGICRNLLK